MNSPPSPSSQRKRENVGSVVEPCRRWDGSRASKATTGTLALPVAAISASSISYAATFCSRRRMPASSSALNCGEARHRAPFGLTAAKGGGRMNPVTNTGVAIDKRSANR
eukprot:CAMPEP_0177744524 /NCGR_PEP_ID=MMETSP0484_2-20121128/29800_1 /TAXON_ID=354590 /ORGANISM="Rhodomonas lens, Strain RHODO" /LENGTH=109 /DNA_ID=CAMNT_0019259049 /DNA_START=198 /DNA_END=523 /DNA_ORIENTATION=+